MTAHSFSLGCLPPTPSAFLSGAPKVERFASVLRYGIPNLPVPLSLRLVCKSSTRPVHGDSPLGYLRTQSTTDSGNFALSTLTPVAHARQRSLNGPELQLHYTTA